MSPDEMQIRELVRSWHVATEAGDTNAVLDLMTDDVVFLTPGRPPMNKGQFAQLSAVPPGASRPNIALRQEIKEVTVSGEVAFLWSALSVRISAPEGAAVGRNGHTLTVFKKVAGRWLLARDANLLSPRAKT
jgi:uncharacterized protein (TIGR02246 family)